MFGISMQELLIVLAILLILFGGAKIPQLARSLGQSITEFKKGASGKEDEISTTTKEKENV